MAGKTKNMSQIKQLLILHQQEKGKKTIASILGMSKNTVKEYLQKLSALTEGNGSLFINELLSLEDPILEAKFHSGNPAFKEDERYGTIKDLFPYFFKELKRTGVTRHLLWEEYRQKHTDGYGYSQFCYHLQQYQNAAKPTLILTHKPADKLYVDFAGSKLGYINRESGEYVSCEIFVACLPYSDYSFAMAVPSQQSADFLYALECCLINLGGVPAAIVPDNLKSAVIKTSRYEPDINQSMQDFANHYHTTVVPARPYRPRDKSSVENQVKILYSRVYAKLRNRQFFDISSLNEAIAEKVKDHNQTRMQQRDYCREEKFLSEEKGLLKPLPTVRFEMKSYKQLKVAQNNHIYLSNDKHYYSVPYRYIGKKVKVIYTRKMVFIFSGGEQIAVHVRDYKKSSYTTDKNHLCSHHQHYLNRSPEYYISNAARQSVLLGDLVKTIFNQGDKYPEQLYKSCDGLFSLYRNTEKVLFENACKTALYSRVYSYGFIKNCIDHKMPPPDEDGQLFTALPHHDNIRGRAHYK